VELGRWVENHLTTSSRLPLFYSHPIAFRSLGSMFEADGGNCGVCGIYGILGVLASGAYALCGIGETVPELVFGHAVNDLLEVVWNETPVLHEIREGLPRRFEGVCGQCLMKALCNGSCIAQNFYRDRYLWAGNWYCEDAFRKGLFPASRLNPNGGRSSCREELRAHDASRLPAMGG